MTKWPQKSHIFSFSLKNCNIVIAFFHSETVQRKFLKNISSLTRILNAGIFIHRKLTNAGYLNLVDQSLPTYIVKTTLVLIPLFISKELLKVTL